MKISKIAGVIVALFMVLCLTSCSGFDMNIENLLTPPKQDGNIYPIQQALEAEAGNRITLKYPISGDYRTAFTFMNIDADATEEVVALYSTNKDNTVMLNVSIIDYENNAWISHPGTKIVGSDIEKITFCDLSGDGIPEIVAGWMIYGTVDKQVGVYTYDGKALKQRAMEKYSSFLCDTLKTEGRDELIVINLDSASKTSTIKTISLNDSGVAETGSAILDGAVTSYSTPVLSTLADGRPALYIDAVKGTGMLTEIVWFEGDTLTGVCDVASGETKLTTRPSAVSAKDIDGNGIIDIPIMSLLPSTAQKPEADKVYVTSWCCFDGNRLSVVQNSFMNYTDGYYLNIPSEWINQIHLARKTDSRQRIFYSYDTETQLEGDEVFRIVAATVSEIESGKFDSAKYEELGSYSGIVYLTKIIENNTLGITLDMLKNNFHVIKYGGQ